MKLGALAVAVLVLVAAAPARADEATYRVVPEKSKLTFKAFRDGWFSSLGHDHVLGGRDFDGAVRFDPVKFEASSVTLSVRTNTLEVLDPGVDADDKKEIDATLKGDEVLDAAKYPEIRFVSTSVRRDPKIAGRYLVKGDLTLHGVTKAIEFPVEAKESEASAQGLRATGKIELKTSDYGMKPYGVGLGAVKVKDGVVLEFEVVAAR
jgi:polyisoprenoid-binding protein YceI